MAWAGANGRLPSAAAGLTQTEGEARIARERGWSTAAATSTSVTILKSPEELYRFWKDPTNLPRVLSHVESIDRIADDRSRGTVKAEEAPHRHLGIAHHGRPAEPAHRLGIGPGADVRNNRLDRVQAAPDGPRHRGQGLHRLRAAGGPARRWIAKLFMEEPGVQLRDDLRRFKQIMETGGQATAEGPRPM